MSNVIIAILIGVVLISNLKQISFYNDTKKMNLYQRWYLPWAGLLYSVLMYLVYHLLHVPNLPLINMLSEEYQVEAVYSLICFAIWDILLWSLKSSKIHESLLGLYRKIFAGNRTDKDTALPFPYFLSKDNVVRARVGQVFYRWTLKVVILLVALVYCIFFLLVHFANIDFYLISAFGILGLLPIIEYYVYLCAEVPVENETEITEQSTESDFDELWQIYVDTYDNFSVAWKRENNENDNEKVQTWRRGNDDKFENLMKEFSENEKSIFIENCDLVTAFIRLEPFIDFVEKNGQHVLIALEIPNHFKQKQEKTFTKEIANELESILRKNFRVYDEKSTKSSLNENLVIAPLSLISRQGLDYEWMPKVGLIVVVNIYDKGVSNLYENRKFCYLLKSVNQKFQIIFVTPHRRGTEPSLKNTWLTESQTAEDNIIQFSPASKQFFIGYNYEEYANRFGNVLNSRPNEPLYSGSEMSVIALSKTYKTKRKVVTPIHFVELAYTNAIESPEELGKFSTYVNDKLFFLNPKDIHNEIRGHLLPVEQIVEDKILSIVFDQENNAPVAYRKWRHLGFFENFSIVISKPYLFRDYFNANHCYFVESPFEALEPHLCKSRITLAIILLNMLKDAEKGMEENELRNLLLGYYTEEEIRSVPTIIKTLFSNYFSKDLANMLKTSDVVDFDGVEYHRHTMYELQLTDDVDLRYLDTVTVMDESNNVLFDILYDLMYQNYCKKQIHSFSGKPYIIGDYDRRNKTLKVRAKNSSDQETLFYKPSLKVSLFGTIDPIMDMTKATEKWKHRDFNDVELSLCIEGYETDVTIETDEIYSFTSYHIGSSHSSDNCPPVRHYNKGKVLKVSFNYWKKPEYLEKEDEIRKSLQILIYEALQSLFPHHAQYLIVASEGDVDQNEPLPWIFNRFTINSTSENIQSTKGSLSYYFIEDAHIDLGLIGALSDKDNIWYLFGYIYDYLIWLSEGEPINPDGYKAYLNRTDFDKLSFLKYGTKSLPYELYNKQPKPYFDIELLINFIKDYFSLNDDNKDFSKKRQYDFMGQCDFCAKEMKNSEMDRLDDGRMRCKECGKDAVDTEAQFKQLCDQVKELFKNHLNIDFSTIPHSAQLVSAVKLHILGNEKFSITNGYDARELVGLACDRKDDIFYVENGRKPDDTLGIIAHEMTHIWQYNNDDFKKVKSTDERWVEGLAVWTDLFLSGKNGATDIEERRSRWLLRTDKYGLGLNFIMDTCPDDPYGYIHNLAAKIT